MTTRNYSKVTQMMLNRLMQRCSPYCKAGKWIMPEYALAASVVVGGLMDIINLQLSAESKGWPDYSADDTELDPIRAWASRLGFHPDTINVILRDMDIKVAA